MLFITDRAGAWNTRSTLTQISLQRRPTLAHTTVPASASSLLKSRLTEISQPAKTLIAKLAEACNAVGGVEKKGRNDFQRYDYVKAADVAKAIRHELFTRGIVVIIDEKEWTELRKIRTNSGGELAEMLLKSEVTFTDGAETLGPFLAMATAMDSGDKAIYKAKTGLLKYVLRGIGLIPDEKDDPEFDEAVDEETDPRVLEAGQSTGRRRKKLAEYRVRAFDAACHKSGKTAEQIASYLRVRFSAASIAEINEEDFTDAIKWAMGTEEIAATLATSTQVVASRKKQNGQAQPVVATLDQAAAEIA